MEIWKDIKGYEGIYQVSSLGRVKSFKNDKERFLTLVTNNTGYKKVRLFSDKKGKTKIVHKLVAIEFLNHTPCGHSLVINHKNFNRIDNRVENLEIVTMRENSNLKHLESTSKYTGVYLNKKNEKWVSRIGIKKKQKHLGVFDTEKEASEYFENAVLALKSKSDIVTKKHKYFSDLEEVSRLKNNKK